MGNLNILDVLGDGNFVIRVLPDLSESLAKIEDSEQVRWLGDLQPGYRIHPDLLDSNGHSKLAVIPASDLAVGGYAELSRDLISLGASTAWCGITLCQVSVDDNSDFAFNAAFDGRVVWIEPIAEMTVHNAVVRAMSGGFQ